MTKKAKHLFLTIAVLFLTSCSLDSPMPLSQSESGVSAIPCVFSIPIISDATNPKPGETVYIVPQIEGNTFGWVFSWRAEPDILLDDDKLSASLILPNDTVQIDVELEAINANGCVGTGSLLITVDLPIEIPTEDNIGDAEAEPTAVGSVVTNEAVLVPTAVPTQDPSPTPDPTETTTATKTPTNVPEPLSTATFQPTAVPIADPVITNIELLPGGAIVIEWRWDGVLEPTQNFAVRFWSESDPRPEARFSITWTKGYRHEFSMNNVDFPIGTYLINVAVMEGPSDGIHTEVVRSEDRHLFVNPPPPTTTPPPLP